MSITVYRLISHDTETRTHCVRISTANEKLSQKSLIRSVQNNKSEDYTASDFLYFVFSASAFIAHNSAHTCPHFRTFSLDFYICSIF